MRGNSHVYRRCTRTVFSTLERTAGYINSRSVSSTYRATFPKTPRKVLASYCIWHCTSPVNEAFRFQGSRISDLELSPGRTSMPLASRLGIRITSLIGPRCSCLCLNSSPPDECLEGIRERVSDNVPGMTRSRRAGGRDTRSRYPDLLRFSAYFCIRTGVGPYFLESRAQG